MRTRNTVHAFDANLAQSSEQILGKVYRFFKVCHGCISARVGEELLAQSDNQAL